MIFLSGEKRAVRQLVPARPPVINENAPVSAGEDDVTEDEVDELRQGTSASKVDYPSSTGGNPMKFASLAAIALCVASPAMAETIPEKTGVNSLLGVAPTTQDFVTQAAVSDMFEIQSSKLAEERSDDKTKTFAKKMITDHEKVSSELKSMVQGGKVKADLPTALDSAHASKIDKLKGLKGEDFTKQYHSDQEAGHKDAVGLFKRYAEGGENADLKAWASKTQPELEGHLKMAEDLNK